MTDSKNQHGGSKGGVPPVGAAPDKPKRKMVALDPELDPSIQPPSEWQLETGVYSRDMATQKLKKLEAGDLSIAESAVHKVLKPLPGGGFNPYDNSTRPAQSATSTPAPALRRPVSPAAPAKETALGKLGKWFKGKSATPDDSDYE